MAEVSSHRAGKPCWVDVANPDVDTAIAFYARLFGWEAFTIPDPQAGGYTMFMLRGKSVAAATPTQEGMPPAWSTYFAAEDANETAQKIKDAGGAVIAEPCDVFTSGRMAVAQDPAGAIFSLWQAGDDIGAEIVDEPGSLCWNELATPDADRAAAFYGAVFGWEPEELPSDDLSFVYLTANLDGRPFAGIYEMTEMPPHWSVYFAVDGTDAAATRTSELGGKVLREPFDSPYGRITVLADTAGARFSAITLAPQD